jgi:apolipoprotein N-acyltransferase
MIAIERKPKLVAFLLGVLACFALPPFHFTILLLPAFSGLFLLIWHSRSPLKAFVTGWMFGLGYFASGLYWFAHALLVEPEKFAWMIPFAIFGLPSILAIYYGIIGYLTAKAKQKLSLRPILLILLFSALWLIVEWLRGQLFTGFPWNLISYSWGYSDPMSQFVWLIGSYPYTAWTVLLSSLPATLFIEKRQKMQVGALLATFLMLLIPFGYGLARLDNAELTLTDHQLHLVQGNIPQQHKWDPERQYQTVQDYVRLSQKEGLQEDAIIIWPETAYPYFLEAQSPPVQFIADALPKKGVLLTGAMRVEWHEGRKGIKHFYNSLHAVLPDASVAATYDKVRLVPFGEFVPLRKILPVEKITHGIQDFKRGMGAELLSLDALQIPPFQPLICYETIFPEFTSEGAEWLLNVTNDAWFGHSAGPYQHLQMSRFRAIEQGLPMVRAANTGISAVYDGYGRELGRLSLGVKGTLTVNLPKPVE